MAKFIGTPQINLFDNAELIREGNRYCVKLGSHIVELSPEKQAALAKNNVQSQTCTLGVRPEHISLTKDGIPASADVSEMMGSSIYLHVTSMGRDVVLVVSTLDMTTEEVNALTYGADVSFTFPGSVCHLFSGETGINLEA